MRQSAPSSSVWPARNNSRPPWPRSRRGRCRPPRSSGSQRCGKVLLARRGDRARRCFDATVQYVDDRSESLSRREPPYNRFFLGWTWLFVIRLEQRIVEAGALAVDPLPRRHAIHAVGIVRRVMVPNRFARRGFELGSRSVHHFHLVDRFGDDFTDGIVVLVGNLLFDDGGGLLEERAALLVSGPSDRIGRRGFARE